MIARIRAAIERRLLWRLLRENFRSQWPRYAIAIVANGGRMPVNPEAWASTGLGGSEHSNVAVGAERLMKSAESLNAAGRTRDADAVKAVAPETLALLDDLIHFVSGHVPPHSAAR